MATKGHFEAQPGAASRFALAYERLAAEDEARREWLERAAREPDPDEVDLARTCPVCGDTFGGDMRRTVCEPCGTKGFISTPCRRCGGPLMKGDTQGGGRSPERLGCCATCRAAMPPDRREEHLAAANAALAEKRGSGGPRAWKTGQRQRQRDVERAKRRLAKRGYLQATAGLGPGMEAT